LDGTVNHVGTCDYFKLLGILNYAFFSEIKIITVEVLLKVKYSYWLSLIFKKAPTAEFIIILYTRTNYQLTRKKTTLRKYKYVYEI